MIHHLQNNKMKVVVTNQKKMKMKVKMNNKVIQMI